MKKTIALLLTMVLMLCSLGTAVLADDTAAPVITDAYIGGFPVEGYNLHAVVDGTYGGTAFEELTAKEQQETTASDGTTTTKTVTVYVVSAKYVWEYADSLDSETWTTTSANKYTNRVCPVTENMVGKYVRCTITPSAEGVAGEPVTVVFPTKIMAAADANWQETTKKSITFDSADDLDEINKYANCTVSYDADKKAMKITDWTLTDGIIKDSKVGFSVSNVPVKTDTITVASFAHYTDQGTIADVQTGVESGTYGATTSNNPGDPVRGGFYSQFTVKNASNTTTTTIKVYEVALKSANTDKSLANTTSVMTSGILEEADTAWTYWCHPHMDAKIDGVKVGGSTVTDATAMYIDDIKVVQKTIPYTVTVTDGTETVKTETVGTGDSLTVDLSVPGKKVVSAKVNGADAEIIDNSVSLERIYQDYEIAVTYEDVAIDRLSLENNHVAYVGEDCEDVTLNLTAYEADGAKYDVTGMEGVTYTSSDASVFTVSGNKVSASGKTGKAVITAAQGEKTVSVVMTYQPANLTGTNALAGNSYGVKTEANMPSKYKLAVDGHNDTAAYGYTNATTTSTTLLTEGSSKAKGTDGNNYTLRHISNRAENWFDRGYRSFSAWFHDDLVSPVSMYMAMFDGMTYSSKNSSTGVVTTYDVHTNMAEDMNYGEFDDWGNYVAWSAAISSPVQTSGDNYSIAGGKKTIPRSKGWHQVVFELVKNPESPNGWSVLMYLDGIVVHTQNVSRLTSAGEPCFEVRGYGTVKELIETKYTTDAETGAQTPSSYVYSAYPTYYDDFVMGGALTDDIAGVHYTVGENGSVSAGNTVITDDTWDYVTVGTDVALELAPDNGYQAKVTVDGNPVTVSSNNQLTVENITEDTEIAVTFEKVDTTPVITVNSTVMDGGTQTVDGVNYPSYLVYSSITNYGTVTGYGMKLSDGTNTKDLPAGATTEKTALELLAASQGKFAFRVFGKAIDENECTLTPYYEIDGEKQYSSASNSFGGTTKE